MNTILTFTTPLNARVAVTLPTDDSDPRTIAQTVIDAQRAYGRFGWSAIEIPYGGYQFPLANEPDFDWTLLGASPGTRTGDDGEKQDGVWFRNEFYRRRELEPNKKFKMSAAIKYSRGSNGDEAPGIQVENSGDFKYVTLAIFRGAGTKRPELAKPPADSSQTRTPSQPPPSPAPTTASFAPDLDSTPENHQQLLDYIREHYRSTSGMGMGVIDGRPCSIPEFVHANGETIKHQFSVALATANAIATLLHKRKAAA